MGNSFHLNEIGNKILETSIDGFFMLDADGVIFKANDAYCNMLGYLEQELIGMSVTSLDVKMTAEEVEMKNKSVIKNGNDRFKTQHKHKDGSIIEIEVSVQYYDLGIEKFFTVFARDITRQKHILSELEKKQERLSLVEEIANIGYFERDIETETHYWSDHAYRIFGIEPHECEGGIEKFMAFVHLDDKKKLIDTVGNSINQDDVTRTEFRIIRKDGNVRKVRTLGKTFFDSNGKAASIVATIQDITEMTENLESLARSEERFCDVALNAGEWIWETDEKGRYTYSSPAVEKFLGYKPEEILQKHFYDLFQVDNKQELKKAAFEVFSRKENFHGLLNKNIHRDGHVVILETSGVPVIDKEGKLVGYRGVDRDITQRKNEQERLKASEERFRMLSEATFEGIVIHDKGRFVESNQQFAEMFGLTIDEIKGMNGLEFIAPKSRDIVRENIASGKTAPYETVGLRKDGTTFPIEIQATHSHMYGRPVRIAACRDMTFQKQIQNELLQKEQEIRSVFEASNDSILVLDKDRNYLYANQSALDHISATHDMMIGKNITDALAHIPDFMHRWMRYIDRAFAIGELFVVEDTDLIDGRIVHSESTISPIRDSNGNMLAVSVVYRDVTDKVEMQSELSEYKDQVFQSQRLSYINSLGGMVAHELNQPLTAMSLHLGNAIHLMGDSDESFCQFVKQDILRTLDETNRSIGIIKKFRRLCENPSVVVDKPANIITVADKIKLVMKANAQRANIEIKISSSGDIPEIKINEFVLEQILLTIIQNAIDASDRKSKHQLRISARKLNKEQIELIFADDCGGIEPGNLEKIFQPFFTTKKDGKSMGLGLEIAKQMLVSCDGDIRVESEFGKGTTFYLVLPIDKYISQG